MPRKQKVQAAPQEQYGDRQQLEQAQQAQPLPQEDPMQAALAMPAPGGIMNQPVDPNLPPTDGLPTGPGANSVQPPPQQRMRQADVLRLAAQMSNNPQLATLAQRIESGGQRLRSRVPGGTVMRNV